MFQQIFVPTQQHHRVELPDEFYGKKVQVVAYAVEEEPQPVSIAAAQTFYDSMRFDFTGFKFDRNEANER